MNRLAYIAHEPGMPGAVGYVNAETVPENIVRDLIENWIERGCAVEKVTLVQAIHELSLYTTARRNAAIERGLAPLPGLGGDTPMMLRPQAD